MLGGRRITDRLAAYRRSDPAGARRGDGRRRDRDGDEPRRPLRERDRRRPALGVPRGSHVGDRGQLGGLREVATLRGGGHRRDRGGRQARRRPASACRTSAVAPDFVGNQMWFNTPGDRPLSLRAHCAGMSSSSTSGPTPASTASARSRTWRPGIAATTGTGFDVVGVHTPEFPFEREASATSPTRSPSSGSRYPVAQDNDYATWDAYQNQYWPADYLVDASGHVRLRPLRGGAATAERRARFARLLAEAGHPTRWPAWRTSGRSERRRGLRTPGDLPRRGDAPRAS